MTCGSTFALKSVDLQLIFRMINVILLLWIQIKINNLKVVVFVKSPITPYLFQKFQCFWDWFPFNGSSERYDGTTDIFIGDFLVYPSPNILLTEVRYGAMKVYLPFLLLWDCSLQHTLPSTVVSYDVILEEERYPAPWECKCVSM